MPTEGMKFTGPLYRKWIEDPRHDGPVIVCGSDLSDCISHEITCAKPAKPECPEGEWYCENPGCVVRTVKLFFKLHGEQMPVKLLCPVCQGSLKFHHWLDHETYVPVDIRQLLGVAT